MVRYKKNKIPHYEKLPAPEKTPKTSKSFLDYKEQKISWVLGSLDKDGEWSILKITKECFISRILEKIHAFESMYWKEIVNNENNHEVSIEKLINVAQKRLQELKIEDIESLFSLRLSGKERIYGIRVGSIFKVLWWDPNHEICPSILKHT